MTERILKFPLLYLENEKIQSGKIQNYIYYFEFFHSGFPCWEDKKSGNFKNPSVVFYPSFMHTLLPIFFKVFIF